MGRGHVRCDDPGRGDRCGHLAGDLRDPQRSDADGAAVPHIHPLRGHAVPDADRYAQADSQGSADADPHRDAGADRHTDSCDIQPATAGVPHSTTSAYSNADTDAHAHSGRCNPHADANCCRDPGPNHAAELHSVADRDPHCHSRVGRVARGVRPV
jgi:hypothetical protein